MLRSSIEEGQEDEQGDDWGRGPGIQRTTEGDGHEACEKGTANQHRAEEINSP